MLACVVVPAAFVGFIAFGLLKTTGPKATSGTALPEFELQVLGSTGTLSSADLAGRPLVINFWASWCIPCREEALTLERAWNKYKNQGVQFLGVNVQDSERDAQAFVKEMGITFPTVRDTDLKLWTKFGVRGLPETFFVDHTGRFVGVGSGKLLENQGGTKILGAIDPALLNSQIETLLGRRRAGKSE